MAVLTAGAMAQHPSVRAVYYHGAHQPRLIVDEYCMGDSATFLIHNKSESACITRTVTHHSDTMIVQEDVFLIHDFDTQLGRLLQCDKFMISRNSAGDTVHLRGYKAVRDTLLADTLITGPKAISIAQAISNHGNSYARVELILNGSLHPNLDSLEFLERSIQFLVDSIPVKWQAFDSDLKISTSFVFTQHNNKLIYVHFGTTAADILQVDTISFNRDTSLIEWRTFAPGKVDKFETARYTVQGQWIIRQHDTYKGISESQQPLRDLLVAQLYYREPLFWSPLQCLAFKRPTFEASGKNKKSWKYERDGKGRIIRQTETLNAKNLAFLEIQYFD